MFCKNCGKELREGDKFCPFCGCREDTVATETLQFGNVPAQNNIKAGDVNEVGKGKKRSIKWLIASGAMIIIGLWLILGGGSDTYIEMVQDGVLNRYDYGICIGDALHEWFAGTEEWDCYEEDDNIFVVVTGSCPYALTEWDEVQTFYFKIMDDEHFRFLGAYTDDGSTICSTSGNSVADELAYSFIDWVSPLYEIDFYEGALEAAFGDKESMDIFRSVNE